MEVILEPKTAGRPVTRLADTNVRLLDSFGRAVSKLRISVTDRCNFRCTFCMPEEPLWIPRSEVLSYEEIARLAGILASMGVTKVRLSGGEPLVRKEVERLVRLLGGMKGIESVSMTTNGALLEDKAEVLWENGLKSVTVSLHSLKADLYDSITGTREMFGKVLRGIQKAKDVGLKVKINCVVIKGCNEDEVISFSKLAHDGDITVRFIEYMPFDGNRFWGMEKVVSGKEIVERVKSTYELVKLSREYGSTADLYGFAEGSRGKIGTITSMTAPFCGDCDRIRLKADGKIVPCLFSTEEYDVKPALRSGGSDEEIARFIRESFWKKAAGVETMIKEHKAMNHIRPMHTIGG